jgi:hypothetical protein
MWLLASAAVLTTIFAVAVGGSLSINLTSIQSHISENLGATPNYSHLARVRFPPQHFVLIDEAKTDDDFFIFLQKLRQAVKRRDAKFIHTLVNPETRFSFGDGPTLEDLDIDNPKAPFWLHLQKAIAIGCSKHETNSPQTSTSDNDIWNCPPLELHQSKGIGDFEQVFIVGEQIKVRAEPNDHSRVVGIISYEVVEFDYEGLSKLSAQEQDAIETLYGWMPVILSNDQRGFVRSLYAYRIIGYRVYLVKSKGQWQLMSFLAGD